MCCEKIQLFSGVENKINLKVIVFNVLKKREIVILITDLQLKDDFFYIICIQIDNIKINQIVKNEF